MSELGEGSVHGSFREALGTAESDNDLTQTRTAGGELACRPPAEPMSREAYAAYVRQRPAADIGHDVGDLTGQLAPDERETTGALDTAATKREHCEPGKLGPSRIEYHDGRQYQITGSPEDGLWIHGMPGDPPAAPEDDPYGTVKVGEYIPEDAEADDKPKRDQFMDALFENSDDILDDLDHFGAGMTAIIDRGPRPIYSGTLHEHRLVASPAPDQGIDGGHLLSAAMAVAMLGIGIRHIRDRARATGEEGGVANT
jgi:hypothetical protein